MKNNLTRSKFIGTTTILVSILLSSVAHSGGKQHSAVDWAHVTRSEPIIRTIQHSTPREECWNENVRYEERYDDRRSHTSTIMGGIIGGAVGNALGHKKKNKRIGTAVGAILGASIGSDMGSHNKYRSAPISRYRNEKRCSTSHTVSYEEKVVGYHVWYRYHGEKYKTRMDHKPNKKIKVRVIVEPF
jgi:uncharacterized protein YcfJ